MANEKVPEEIRRFWALLDMPIDAHWREINTIRGRAAASTVEALMYELRTHGLAALAGPNCRRRFSELSQLQLVEVIERLMKLRPKYPAITDELLFQLGEHLL
jgi:hypothetical protein